VIGEFLYQIRDRDEQLTWLEPVLLYESVDLANVLVTAITDIVPERNLLYLTSAVVRAVAGGAQAVSSVYLQAVGPDGISRIIHFVTTAGLIAAPASYAANFSGALYVPPGWYLSGAGVLNPRAAANTVQHTVTRQIHPLGNLGR
jgi:hypothetical protein